MPSPVILMPVIQPSSPLVRHPPVMHAEQRAIHFSGLNAFRFLAASLVVLVHLKDIHHNLHRHASVFWDHVSNGLGGLAVTFFFVLSGFLITYLLLAEKETFGTIAVKNFYWRRILRIWPLYYLIIFLAFALLNNPAVFPSIAGPEVYQHAPTNLLLYLFLLPNVAWVSGLQIMFANQLWSVGVEEQFYLVWPVLMKSFNKRNILLSMLSIVGGFVVARNGAAFMSSHHMGNIPFLAYFGNLMGATRIDCMAIGGLGAYAFYYYPEATRRFISSTVVDVAVAALVVGLVYSGKFIPYVQDEIYGSLFCYIILSSSCKEGSVLRLENKLWSFLGKLSYGVYMWHMIVLGLLLAFIRSTRMLSSTMEDGLLYVTTLPVTILVAWLSYKYVEMPFLKRKKQYVLVDSRT